MTLDRPDRFDLWWGRVVRVASFVTGAGIMVYETGFDKGDRPWLYAAAVGMMGLPIGRAAESVLSKISNVGPREAPSGVAADTEIEEPKR